MADISEDAATSLLVFADDWGRHPSSCQHLVSQLLSRRRVVWVNTIGMRQPRLDAATFSRGYERLRQWTGGGVASRTSDHQNLRIVTPIMWPSFSSRLERRLNRHLLAQTLREVIAELRGPVVAVTTIPVVADLMATLPVQRWVYYCVDDFSNWPGLDKAAVRRLEKETIAKADLVITVSENLQQSLARLGRTARLLTHGVDLDFWRDAEPAIAVPELANLPRPLVTFWGVVDRRMDVAFVQRLAADMPCGTIVLVGPHDNPDPDLLACPRVVSTGALSFAHLPHIAKASAVLIMPYADLPVTRAMQPLKLKEYLATGRPVVLRDLPATRPWSQEADVMDSPASFSRAVRLRLESGLPTEQRQARLRLQTEGWPEKARLFENWIAEPLSAPAVSATRSSKPVSAPVTLNGRAALPPARTARSCLLVFADDWGRHPSSCQHLIRRLRTNLPVLWVNTVGTRQMKADSFTLHRSLEKLKNWAQGLKKVDDQMWTIDMPMLPGLSNQLLRQVNRRFVCLRLRQIMAGLGLDEPTILTTLPYTSWLVAGLPRESLVYYCTDDYSYWPSADRATLQQADREISQEADLILAASGALYEQHAQYGRCRYFPHGVDFEHFAAAGHVAADPGAAGLPGPRIGFFGLIYEKLNFDLLAAVARKFSQGSVVMIGPRDYCPKAFEQIPNVHFLGRKPYDDLPRYLAALDVLLLPYVDDPMIRRSGPLKLRECLATGKPTVSIDVPDVRVLEPHVRVAADQSDFVAAVAAAVAEPADAPAREARRQAVRADSWDSRALVLRQEMHKPGNAAEVKRPGCGRVLHLRTVSGRGGGPEKTILNSPRFLQGRYDLHLAFIRPEGDPDYDIPERAQRLGVDLVDVPERNGFDPRTLWRLAREIRRFRPHILHAHDYKTNALGILLGRWFGIPVMTTMHGYVGRGGRLEAYYLCDRWSLRQMDHVVAVSDDLYQMLVDWKLPMERRTLLWNGIDTEEFRRSLTPTAARARLGLEEHKFLIGAVGRLAPEKGFDVLIRAVAQLCKQGLDAGLVIGGEGEEKNRLQGLIDALDLGARVRLLGHVSQPHTLYQAVDVFALSSLREGLPNVLLEAMALEAPVVATTAGGVAHLVTHGKDGLLVKPGSAEELAQALSKLAGDGNLRSAFSRAGRQTIETEFSFASRMRVMESIYDTLCSGACRQKKASPAGAPPQTLPRPLVANDNHDYCSFPVLRA